MKDVRLKGNWNEQKRKSKEQHGDLTHSDQTYEKGRGVEIFGIIQKKLGITVVAFTTVFMLMFGTVFTGCESNQDRVADAKEDVRDAKEDLAEVKQDVAKDAQERANDEEWRVFKEDAEAKIRDNEARIKRIKEERKSSGNAVKTQYEKDIEALEARNRDLETRINTYDRSEGNWESFKREFNHDMESFGKAFKDLGVDNKR